MGGGGVTSAAARHLQCASCGLSLLPPLSHSSSSLPSKQSASASQCHRSGMQWPFLHWYWSLSHFTSQPSYGNAENCALAPRATVARGTRCAIPRPIRQHSRGRRRTSSGRRCNGRSRRQTRSPNTGEALATEGGQSRRRNHGQIGRGGEGGKKQGEEKAGSRADCKSMNNKG